ncbi:MAG: NADH-quinone oxidoreductase subunit L [Alphaproteobacteria bacterium]|nr:NADH-quinone oxidoreductase subunit L [Alphaproteobacteria bacterium]
MELWAVFPPLFGFLMAFLFGKQMGDKGAQLVTCAGIITAAFVSCMLFVEVIYGNDGHGDPRTVHLMTWMASGAFAIDWSLRVDQLSVVMMCVVNIVSACVHVYSVGYMSHDKCKARFMAYLSLFTFAMLMLVTADNLLQLFFGWEGVGVASYLLIGFWNHKDSANAAAIKAFVVNRVGDFGLALGVFAAFVLFGTVQFDAMFALAPEKANEVISFLGIDIHAITLVALLLFMGAMGKSAQLGLHTWLPDAMEGPTPVSALIHAATMVTAGVFLVARMSPVFEYAPDALLAVTLVGAATAFVAATIGMTQFDIKRVIAYSTMSQLGYMFFALGVGAYPAAIFHLMTHAFFKALLFLGAGSVIHAMSDEQDMRKMGGIWKMIPTTYVLMWIGSLALAGVPFFAGFYSKDIILEAAYADHTWFGVLAYYMGIAAAIMTAFYSTRLLFMTFHGKPRAEKKVMDHVHESPSVMLTPLMILGVGAVFSGWFFYEKFVGHHPMWGDSIRGMDAIDAAHHVPYWVKKLPIAAGTLGLVLGWVFYLRYTSLPGKFVKAFKPVHTLLFNKWFFDELYTALFVKPSFALGKLSWASDRNIVDGLGPDGVAKASRGVGRILSRFQSGYVFQYAFVMMIGLIAIVSWFYFKMTNGQG